MAFQTSALYKEAMLKPSRISTITGKLTTSTKVINITNDVVSAGSCYITNQCVNGDAFQFGSVFSAEASLTLKADIDRYKLFGAKVVLNYNVLLSNDEYETIPLGEFYVNEPTRVGKNITIKCYDKMLNLDKQVSDSTEGEPFELLLMIAERCDVELAQTQEEIEALTNGTKLLSVQSDRVETYRDLLSYIGLVTCTFGHIDRYGKLRLTGFSTTPSKEISPRLRSSSKFSDFQSYHTSAAAKFVESGTYKSYKATLPTNTGLLYNLGECPLVQGLASSNQEALDNILETLSMIRYIPGEFTFNGDPSVDLGDMLKCIEMDGTESNVLVTYFKWTYHGGHQIKSAGLNPKLTSTKESKNKDLANLEAELKKKDVPVYSATNSFLVKAKGGDDISNYSRLVRVSCATNESATLMLMFNCHFSLDYDGYVEFLTYIDGVLYENSNVVQYCLAGDNDVSFVNYLLFDAGVTSRVSIYVRTYCDETPFRVQQAQIETSKNMQEALASAYSKLATAVKSGTTSGFDTAVTYEEVTPSEEVPTMVTDKFHAKLLIFGQGLAGTVAWDGTIEISEMFDMPLKVDTTQVRVGSFSSSVSSETQVPQSPSFISESFSPITIKPTPLQISGISDSFEILNGE